MNLLDRLLLVLYSLSVAIIAIIFTLVPFNFLPNDYKQNVILFISRDSLTAVIAFILFITSIRFLFTSFSSKTFNSTKTIKKETEWGQINISYNTIEQLAHAASKKVNGIRDINIKVTELESHIIINVLTSLMNDVNIPATTEELQKSIKDYVENFAGVRVKEVRVTIDDLNNNMPKRRVD
jgi:Uncharacterized protein conserved in bacteria